MTDTYHSYPDPARAESNVRKFLEENPKYTELFKTYKNEITLLFSYSQFLANFCTLYPESLFVALNTLNHPLNRDRLKTELKDII
ncbi:MAG: hypothetical protein N2738_02075, partial [Thermodesulfovibrionales bacterium]|nr:hypothetical protein [Thermodesulfovibrionales bacterium]